MNRSSSPAQHQVRVDFVIAGTQKGGTSALDHYLRDHLGLCMARPRENGYLGPHKVLGYPNEPHFFDTEAFFSGDSVDTSHYHALFSPSHGQICGECTPAYMYWQDAPRRMWQYNPALKIIVVLRDPVERAYSHWQMMCRLGFESLCFEEAIAREPDRCRAALPLQHRHYSYLDRGFYTEQLRRLWRFFDPSQLLVLRSTLLARQPRTALDLVCRFLQIEPFAIIHPIRVNAGNYNEPMDKSTRAKLRQHYQHEIRALEWMLGWDCSDWLAQDSL